MATHVYDARFLCLRTDLPERQRAPAQLGRQVRGKQKPCLRAPMASLDYQCRATTLTPPLQLTPPRYKLAVITWLALFPLITIILALFGPLLLQLPLVVRTFVLTATLVPAMIYLIVPLYMQLFAGWLNQTAPDSSSESDGARNLSRRHAPWSAW